MTTATGAKRAITRADILDPAVYGRERRELKRKIAEVKRNRRIEVGPFVTFYFENYETMWHQVHEMLHIERGGEAQIADELAVDLLLAAALDMQHLEHLEQHGVVILEIERGERADIHPPALLHRGDGAIAVATLFRVLLHRHDVGSRDFMLHRAHHDSLLSARGHSP